MRRGDCHDGIKGVRLRFELARQTIRTFREIARQRPELLHDRDLDEARLVALKQELHDVYFTRMFASFESSLRHFWRMTVRDSRPSTETLLTSIAIRRGVPQDTLDAVHEVRKFRNHLIHDEHEDALRFTIDEASRHLNTYLARLPLVW